MSNFSFVEPTSWQCGCCGHPLKPTQVKITYLRSVFSVELMGCSACGFIFVPESLALGKMLEVEQLLEDK